MNRKDSTFFMAYLWFLFLCILCKIANQFFRLPWADVLDNLILAVSVSGFFFTASDICAAGVRHDRQCRDATEQSSAFILSYLDRCIRQFDHAEDLPQEKRMALDVLKKEKEKREQEKEQAEKGGRPSKLAIVLDGVGFLAFLACLLFSPLAKALRPIQDILVLVAFFSMLYFSFICVQYDRETADAAAEGCMTAAQLKAFCAQLFDGWTGDEAAQGSAPETIGDTVPETDGGEPAADPALPPEAADAPTE